MQPKKSFALIDYEICNPEECNPSEGICASAKTCQYRVINQIDGIFEPPMIFQDMCMGCWDCIEACPLDSIQRKHIA
jgi:ATP-binding cassette subfamily E protein 1